MTVGSAAGGPPEGPQPSLAAHASGLERNEQDLEDVAYLRSSTRRGIALCLSGGGFRAALYHLGALRCLNDFGILARVDAIASVSGGSILAGFLATHLHWPLPGALTSDEWEQQLAAPFRDFVSRDHRTGPLLYGKLGSDSAVDLFASDLAIALCNATLSGLPDSKSKQGPEFIVCASNLTLGGLWRFERDQVGDDEIGFAEPWAAVDSLALAIAISASFPPLFPFTELPLNGIAFERARPTSNPQPTPQIVELNDGGTYDNLGLEAVWRDYEVLLVSDGGAPLLPSKPLRWGIVGRAIRSSDLNDSMGRLARRRWFIMNLRSRDFLGAYWGIANSVADHSPRYRFGYSPAFVAEIISPMRTDLDAFSKAEQFVLENHGYASAFASIKRWGSNALQLHLPAAPVCPHQEDEWWDEPALRAELAHSHRRFRTIPRVGEQLKRACRTILTRIGRVLRRPAPSGTP